MSDSQPIPGQYAWTGEISANTASPMLSESEQDTPELSSGLEQFFSEGRNYASFRRCSKEAQEIAKYQQVRATAIAVERQKDHAHRQAVSQELQKAMAQIQNLQQAVQIQDQQFQELQALHAQELKVLEEHHAEAENNNAKTEEEMVAQILQFEDNIEAFREVKETLIKEKECLQTDIELTEVVAQPRQQYQCTEGAAPARKREG
ncbi:hypothetical protein L208DRAFT_1375917 [Tricholoma matsutake]|nr:hypothetical protein L208DRAFT_1375917 [Tricholoma matsutake 945]